MVLAASHLLRLVEAVHHLDLHLGADVVLLEVLQGGEQQQALQAHEQPHELDQGARRLVEAILIEAIFFCRDRSFSSTEACA